MAENCMWLTMDDVGINKDPYRIPLEEFFQDVAYFLRKAPDQP
jgi:hypothetical protein